MMEKPVEVEMDRGAGGRGWWKGLRVSTPEYYAVCAVGGMLSAGTTHLAVTPLDVLKVNMQAWKLEVRDRTSRYRTSCRALYGGILCRLYLNRPLCMSGSDKLAVAEFIRSVNPMKYTSIVSGLSTLVREQGPSALWRGWGGKLYGYGAQGGFKFGLYEYFKNVYSELLVGQNRTFVYLLSSASAQVFADVALCPFEAVKVRVQTQPRFAKGLVDGFPKLYASEGFTGFYRGLLPLWGRNLPFSILMFSTFEHSVDILYHHVIQKRKEDCSRVQQLSVTCMAGYISGAAGTVISNPADNIVSSLYNKKADSALQAMRNIGLINLFTRSLPVRFTLVGPLITLQWFFYDTIKVFTGLPTSGGTSDDYYEVNS